MTPDEALRAARYRLILESENQQRPAAERMDDAQITSDAREAAVEGHLNEHGRKVR